MDRRTKTCWCTSGQRQSVRCLVTNTYIASRLQNITCWVRWDLHGHRHSSGRLWCLPCHCLPHLKGDVVHSYLYCQTCLFLYLSSTLMHSQDSEVIHPRISSLILVIARMDCSWWYSFSSMSGIGILHLSWYVLNLHLHSFLSQDTKFHNGHKWCPTVSSAST